MRTDTSKDNPAVGAALGGGKAAAAGSNDAFRTLRADFPILERLVHGKRLAYLDNAATSLKPRAVVEALSEHFLYGAANVHRGVHRLSEEASSAYDAVRVQVASFIGAGSDSEVIWTSGTTASINLLARAYTQTHLQPGDEVLVSEMEHHANIVPWQILARERGIVVKYVPIDDNGDLRWPEFLKLLGPRTKIVAMVYVSNSLGTVNNVREVAHAARQVGAVTFVDAAQAMLHQRVDVRDLGCDALVFSAHKMLGPTGVGVLWGKHEILEPLTPIYGGGEMIRRVSFSGTSFAPLPNRLEPGTPNIGGVIAFGKALAYLEALNWDEIQRYEAELLRYGTESLTAIAGVRIIGTARKKAPVLSFTMEGIHPHDLGSLLDHDGVAIRTGHHCTQPVMERFAVPATSRASLAFYNTREDIDQLVHGILAAKKVFAP